MATEHLILIDKEDEDLLTLFSWKANSGYLRAYVRGSGRKGAKKNIYLHDLIGARMGIGPQVDHINRNRLDNRRVNLRGSTQTENTYNKSKQSNNRSGYLGVVKRGSRFVGYVVIKGKQYATISFVTAEEAARARDTLAVNLHGEFASLNFYGDR